MERKALCGMDSSIQVRPCRAESIANESRKVFALLCGSIIWLSENYAAVQVCSSSIPPVGQ
jgi:hypothetical protein